MAISKQKKTALIEGFTQNLEGMQSLVFLSFKGLSVAETIELRRKLRASGVGYKVIKKTLMKRVLDTKGITGEFPVLAGEVGIAYSTDLLAPAREVFDFSKTHKENCAIVGGIFEGVYKDQAAMLSLATIPSREVLLSQIAFLLKSPLQRLAIAVNEVAKTKS